MSKFKDFLIIADRDRRLCEKAEKFFPDEDMIVDVTYHIQQAIEKELKALLLLYGEQIEFTHNIAKLSSQCKELGISIPKELDDVEDTLTLWESINRYDPYINFSEAKYEKAKYVYDVLREEIKEIESAIEEQEQPCSDDLEI